MYDVSKENDKDVLRAWAKHLQEELLFSKKENIQLRKQRIEDEELCKKLAEELLLMKKRIFDSKQEKKANRARNQKKKRRKGKIPHNQSENKKIEEHELDLDEEIVDYKLENENKCPNCGEENCLYPMNNCAEESTEMEVIERRYILKRHKRQKYSCKGCNNIITAPGGVKLATGGEFPFKLLPKLDVISMKITSLLKGSVSR